MGRRRLDDTERRHYKRMLTDPRTVAQLHDLARWADKPMIRYLADLVDGLHRRETRKRAKAKAG